MMSKRDARRILNRQMRRRRREFRLLNLKSGRAIAMFWEQPLGPPHGPAKGRAKGRAP